MNVKEAYNEWAVQYDNNINKTRDLEAIAIRGTLSCIKSDNCLEIGCGTGKNTIWLAEHTKQLTSADFSERMLAKAKQKVRSPNVNFLQADITGEWEFEKNAYDLVCFSLVLEHIADLDHVFRQVANIIRSDGYVYIGELHPFKQYSGSKAKFETEEGLKTPECFTHHISDFINAAKKFGFRLSDANEYFDKDTVGEIPRILTLLLQKA